MRQLCKLILIFFGAGFGIQISGVCQDLNTARIEELTGAKGKWNEKEGVFKVSVPRSDLSIVISGVKLPPSMGLTAWASFKKMDDHAIVMGDIVLLEDQVNPA